MFVSKNFRAASTNGHVYDGAQVHLLVLLKLLISI